MALIREGATLLNVPAFTRTRGPGKKSGEVFFNSAMAFNRDVTVLLTSTLGPTSFLDAMAATGAMGIRAGVESSGEFRLRLNDPYPRALRYMVANSRQNGLDPELSCLRISEIWERYDHVDIDPFGSPVPYLSTIRLARRSVSLTATDAPVLCGLYPKRCLMRYGARNTEKGHRRKELGLRILLARCVIEGKRYGFDLHPLLSFYMDHYFRVFLVRGKEARGKIELVDGVGPVWIGPLHDPQILDNMMKKIDTLPQQDGRVQKFLGILSEEVKVETNSFYDVDELASMFKMSPPKMDDIIERLKSLGFPSSRTHFDPKGLRTEATLSEIKGIL